MIPLWLAVPIMLIILSFPVTIILTLGKREAVVDDDDFSPSGYELQAEASLELEAQRVEDDLDELFGSVATKEPVFETFVACCDDESCEQCQQRLAAESEAELRAEQAIPQHLFW